MPELILEILRPSVSGTYVRGASSTKFAIRDCETVRLDVDATFPQMMASGSYSPSVHSLTPPTHWITHPLQETDGGTWEGEILRVWGDDRAIL